MNGSKTGEAGQTCLWRIAQHGVQALLLGLAAFGMPAWATDNCDGDSGTAPGTNSFVCGYGNKVTRDYSSAVGYRNTASGDHSSAVGNTNTASGDYSSAVGLANKASGDYSSAFGYKNEIGAGADRSVAIGTEAQVNVNVTGAVALGSDSVATESETISVGNDNYKRRVVNVANGTAGTDAVNKNQLDAVEGKADAAQGTADMAFANAATAQSTANTALANLQAAVNQLLEAGVCNMASGTIACAGSVTLGGATVADGAAGAVAIGSDARVHSSGGVAIGDGATAVMANSVAIGKGATAHSSRAERVIQSREGQVFPLACLAFSKNLGAGPCVKAPPPEA